ncbi:MAG: hypothetical protein ACE5JN_11240 [Candidatus Methylomirabilia bacterium]
MALIVRTFKSLPGRDSELLECLGSVAWGIVRYLGAGSVVICRQDNDPEQFFWIGDRGCESDFQPLPFRKELLESYEHSLAECSPPLSLGFVDEFYHFPPPPYQVWNLEAHAQQEGQADILRGLFDLSRLARRDRHVAGMSLYRVAADPGIFIGFLGLTRGFTPITLVHRGVVELSITGQIERTVVWRPLSVAYQVGRPGSGEGVTGGGEGISSAPFWARSGVLPTHSSVSKEATAEVERSNRS